MHSYYFYSPKSRSALKLPEDN